MKIPRFFIKKLVLILLLCFPTSALPQIELANPITNADIEKRLGQYPECRAVEIYLGQTGLCKPQGNEAAKRKMTKREFLQCRERIGLKWYASFNKCREQCEMLLSSHPELGRYCGTWTEYEYPSRFTSVGDSGPYPTGPYSPIGKRELLALEKISAALGAFEVDELKFEDLIIEDLAKLAQLERFAIVNSKISEFLKSWNFFSAIQENPEFSIGEFQRMIDQSTELLNILEHQFGLVSSLNFEDSNHVVGTKPTFLEYIEKHNAVVAGGRYSDIEDARIQRANEERLRKHFFSYPKGLLSENSGEFDLVGDIVCEEPDHYSPFFGNAIDAFAWVGLLENMKSNFLFEGDVAKFQLNPIGSKKLELVTLQVNDVTTKDGIHSCKKRSVERYVEHASLGEVEWTEEFQNTTLDTLRNATEVVKTITIHASRIQDDLRQRRYAKSFRKRRTEVELLAIPARSEIQADVSRLLLEFDSIEVDLRTIETKIAEIESEMDNHQLLEAEGFVSLEKVGLELDDAASDLGRISAGRLKLKAREATLISEIEDLSLQDVSGEIILEKLEEYSAIQERLFILDQTWKNTKSTLASNQDKTRQFQLTIEVSIDKRALLSIYLQNSLTELERVLPKYSRAKEDLARHQGMLADLSRHSHIQF